MRTIHKQVLQIADEQTIQVPIGTANMYVGTQRGDVCMWYMCDPDNEYQDITIRIYGTGHPIEEDVNLLRYLGTAMTEGGRFVWHVFNDVS